MDITITTSDPESIGAEMKDALRTTLEDLGYYVDLIAITTRESPLTVAEPDTQTEPQALPKPGTEIRADELDGLRSVSIEHPDTGELFTVAKVAWHGDTILLTDYEGSETDIDRDSGVMVVAACAVCEHEIAEDYGLCPSCLHNAKRSGWTPGDPMSDFTGGA